MKPSIGQNRGSYPTEWDDRDGGGVQEEGYSWLCVVGEILQGDVIRLWVGEEVVGVGAALIPFVNLPPWCQDSYRASLALPKNRKTTAGGAGRLRCV